MRLTTSALTVLALAAGIAPGPARAAADEATPPVISSTALSTESGGLTPFIPVGCFLQVTFTDTTPSEAAEYTLVVDGEERDTGFYLDDQGVWHGSSSCGEPGSHDVVIRESGVDSEPADFTFRAFVGPSNVRAAVRRVDGVLTVRAGSVVKLRFTGPDWEKGSTVESRAWSSKGSTFTSDDFYDNLRGRAAVLERRGRTAPTRIRIPQRMVGRWLWISFAGLTGDYGAKGVSDWTLRIPRPVKVLPPRS